MTVCTVFLLGTSFDARVEGTGSGNAKVRADEGAAAFTPFAYGSHPRQRLLALWHKRSATAPRPGLVVLHGGYWTDDRSPHWNTWSARFAKAGYDVFDIDYRRNVDAPWPAQRNDVLAALRWIRGHSASFGVDPRRLYLLGSSAGGHLALSAATYGGARATGVRVRGVIGLSPVTDPLRAWRDGRHGNARERRVRANAEVLAACDPGRDRSARCARIWRDMNVATHLTPDDPPMLLLHSRWDFVPDAHSRALARTGGDAVSVTTLPGSAHGGPLMDLPGVMDMIRSWLLGR
ncbi:alpha/beta hydrolase [Streptomyces sp. NPDC048172]|uniref:alpha/beta hydrolase n=1 Tax=Streptomyces sp. NPDC048172 TaxID=3365505 RepID=UPI00371B28E9